ncbi:Hint domain-containing protein [Marinovum sp.]|uniref:Hint domain-containing protein n=1 Tax=Marinovum sp. TaxID=2024839 RepID=UPI002B26E810|nr:Hint domain-containing protein [Marinovum sp.]
MTFAVLTINTTFSATMEDVYTNPDETHSFTFASGAEASFQVLDSDDAIFDDIGPNDTNQIVGPDSAIFLKSTPVASRAKFTVTPDNGDPSFTVYVVFENSTANDDFSPLNTLDYALVSETPMIAGVNYSVSNHNSDGTVDYSNFSNLLACFAAGTRIATPQGEVAVEALAIGDEVLTAAGQVVPVRWLGRQSVTRATAGLRCQPVRLRAGALGDGVPHSDLTVTADHGMVIDGLLINAAALVNGTSIDWVPMADLPDSFTVYHVETEAHDVILAEGAPAETFIDYIGRQAFDNAAEYLALYGAERIIFEMQTPRISSARLLPGAIRRRLGLADPAAAVSDAG